MTLRTTDSSIAAAAAALRAVASAQGATFLYAGEAIPADTTKLIQLDFVDDLNVADYEDRGEVTRLQVNTVAPKLADAVRLGREVRLRLEAEGFSRRGARRLPKAAGDTLNGIAADFIR